MGKTTAKQYAAQRAYLIEKRKDPVWAANRRKISLRSAHKSRGIPKATRLCPECCECCGGPPTGQGALHVDHDHATGQFRGWLCSKCNQGIGLLGDNLEGAQKAVNYLRVPPSSLTNS